MNKDDEFMLKGFRALPNQRMKSVNYLLKDLQRHLEDLELSENADSEKANDADVDDLLDYATELESELRCALAMQTRHNRELARESRKSEKLIAMMTQRLDGLLNSYMMQKS